MVTYRILSIDGGGIRGVVAAKMLQQIEDEYLPGTSLHESFDMFVGTSTGAVIAAAIANGKKPQDIVELYKDRNQKIFSGLYYRLLRHLDVTFQLRMNWLQSWLAPELKWIPKIIGSGVSLLQGFLSFPMAIKPKYDANNKALRQVMQQELGVDQPTFEHIREKKGKHLVITSYDTLAREKYIFDSDEEEFDAVSVSTAVFCSSSAPTFFPAKQFATGAERCLIDGGLVANNPVTIAIAKALEAGKKAGQAGEKGIKPVSIEEIQVLSIGTGDPTRSISFAEARGWGLWQWASRLPNIFFDGASETNHLVAQALLDPANYLRIQFELNSKQFEGIGFLNDDMDDTRPNNIQNLIKATEQHFSKFKGNMRKAADRSFKKDVTVEETTGQRRIFNAEVKPEQADFFERLKDETKRRRTNAEDSLGPVHPERPFVFVGIGYPVRSQAQKSGLQKEFIARLTKHRYLSMNVFFIFLAFMLFTKAS